MGMMKKIVSVAALSSVLLMLSAMILPEKISKHASAAHISKSVEGVKLRISFDEVEVLVSLYDTQAGREFVAMLPLTLQFEDYAKSEKIAYLPQKLSSEFSPSAPSSGDFAYYAPWGNLAVFYEGLGRAGDLLILGKIESGKEKLAGINRNFAATIEVKTAPAQ